jgi:hypothetical protein
MTEQASLREQIIRPSVEEIHASIPHKGARDLLHEAKDIQRHMNRELEDIETDEDLNPEAKQRRAQEVIGRHGPKIAKAYQDAREKVEAAAESSYNFSLPFPDKKTFAQAQVKDTSEMLAVQGEADSIAARIAGKSLAEITKEVSKHPGDKGIQATSSHSVDALRSEFDAAMKLGGVEGRVRALGVARVCEGMGLPLEQIVEHHRSQVHHNALQDARRFESALHTIPSGKLGTRNPYAGNTRRRGPSGVGTYASTNKVMTGGRPQLFQKKSRRRPWK